MKIPYNDLSAQHAPIRDEIDGAIAKVIDSGNYIGKNGNPFVEAFEKDFAQFTSAQYCIGCANGTDALELALRALGIGEGDEVIVPAQTWISTAEAVSLAGATPIFADISPRTYTLDPNEVKDSISTKTKAIIPVHLYGLPADMVALMAIAKEHELHVVEDCAQAHGATINGKHVGTFGDCGTFSFFPGKNLGAMGDAGGIVTNNPQLAAKLSQLRDHGRDDQFGHVFEGRNSRLDGIQAAILSVKLPYLDNWIDQRQKAADQYRTRLEDLEIPIPYIPNGVVHTFHIYGIELQERDSIKEKLKGRGISTGIHYPIALPFLKAYESKVRTGSYDFALHHSRHSLSLPLYPSMSEEQIDCVANVLAELVGKN